MEILLLNRDVCDQLNAQQIDELLQAKQIKAEEYASQPEIFLLHSFELEMRINRWEVFGPLRQWGMELYL